MIDFLSETRKKIIDNFQISLRSIRVLMGYSASELADYIGVTRQTINNLETCKNKMSPIQYVSLAAVVDNYLITNGDMFDAIEAILDGNPKKRSDECISSFANSSLLKRWFSCFINPFDKNAATTMSINDTDYDATLKRLATEYKVFIDASALMKPQISSFIDTFSDYLISENAKLIIPMRAIEKIQGLVQESRDSYDAINALKLINELQRKNLAQIRGEISDSNLQDTLISVFAKFRRIFRLCLVTDSPDMVCSMKSLNSISDSQGFKIIIAYIDQDGIIRFYLDSYSENETLQEIIQEENDKTASADTPVTAMTNPESNDNDDNSSVEAPPILAGWTQL